MALICFPLVILLTSKILGRMNQERFDTASKIWALVLVGLLVYLIVQ
jgi:hypothetical protein